MNTLPLQQWVIAFRWNYDGKSINKQISKQEAARDNLNDAIIRIGREKPSCNLYLEDISVSGQHAEIYFNEQQQKFFIKSLQPRNITKVDGQDLIYGEELPLNNSSSIVLGQQKIEVTKIQVFELPATNYSGIVNYSPNSNPVNPNLNPVNPSPNSVNPNPNPVNPNPNSIPVNLNLNLSNTDPKPNLNQSKHWWQEPTIQVAIIGAIVAFVGSLLTLNGSILSQQTEKEKQNIQVKADKEKQQNDFEINQRRLYLEKLDKHREKVRELKETMKQKNESYNQLTLVNNDCPNPVRVAVSFTALDEISETRGWFLLEKGIPPVPTGAATTYDAITLFATTTINNKEVIWEPIRTGYIQRFISKDEFNYIQEPFLDANIDKKSPVKFYSVKFDSRVTNKAFKCSDQGTLTLVNADQK
jgi:pSer/pThr/pTyr-binding forkhead associated (FHA) protein